ncbi:hypothetical protein [Endobacterium cereale]|uniref:hypothetical protein n=1 Tax=Endobacterium cereale TaxID=2663029 RepID=UPI002B4A3249|nr:hypothetical protein [Endobacterium cereale]MEB2843809.1 hypothetical protein [Endobacterium cereale]
MNLGFSEEEYDRVRDWLMSAILISDGQFDEAEMLDRLRAKDWHLITTDHAACVLEFCEIDGERIANILVIGGEIGASLREIMIAYSLVCDALRAMKFSYISGQPRKEWHRFLLKYGFEKQKDELIKRL